MPKTPAPAPNWHDWRASEPYLAGIDLFNRGRYWEAHEAWESLWIACGRKGATADFLKGLIKLAAAGVKAKQGRAAGVRRHAARAAQLFRAARAAKATVPLHPGDCPLVPERFMGLAFDDLLHAAELVASTSESLSAGPRSAGTSTAPIFPFVLQPR